MVSKSCRRRPQACGCVGRVATWLWWNRKQALFSVKACLMCRHCGCVCGSSVNTESFSHAETHGSCAGALSNGTSCERRIWWNVITFNSHYELLEVILVTVEVCPFLHHTPTSHSLSPPHSQLPMSITVTHAMPSSSFIPPTPLAGISCLSGCISIHPVLMKVSWPKGSCWDIRECICLGHQAFSTRFHLLVSRVPEATKAHISWLMSCVVSL